MATTHSFDIEEASLYGVEAAILLGNIRYWLTHNKANDVNSFDGYFWTYNSAKAFNRLFPYMTERTIARNLQALSKAGVLKIGNFNATKYDRTSWYTIPAEFALKSTNSQNGKWISQNGESNSQNGESNSQNGEPICQCGEPIPNVNTDKKPNVNTANLSSATSVNKLDKLALDCFEWAKRDKFWSTLVYSEDAFRKHYFSEKQALKGQYENWLVLNSPTKKATAKPIWEQLGFKSVEEYGKSQFEKQMKNLNDKNAATTGQSNVAANVQNA